MTSGSRAKNIVFDIMHLEWVYDQLDTPRGLSMQGSMKKASDERSWADLSTLFNLAFDLQVTGKQLNSLWYTLGKETRENALLWRPKDAAGTWSLQRIRILLHKQPALRQLLKCGGPVIVHSVSC